MNQLFCKYHTMSHIIFLLRELLCDLEVRQKYQRLITNSFVQDHPNLKWCPAPGCPNAVLATNIEYAPISCTCGHFFWYGYVIIIVLFFSYFSFKCSRDPHEPILCEVTIVIPCY